MPAVRKHGSSSTHPPRPVLRLAVLALFALALLLPSTVAAATEPKKVVIIRYPIEPNHFTPLVEAYQETMAQRGYRSGREVIYIDILTTTAEQNSIPEVIAAVEQYREQADLFITSGWVSMAARNILQHSEVPQLFVPVLDSVALHMLPSLHEPPNTNLSGLYLMYPPEKILRLARLLMPELTDYAFVYDSRIPADKSFFQAYRQLPAEARYGINIHYLDLAQGLEPVMNTLQQGTIGAYGGIVGYLPHRRRLAASELPVITAFTPDIEVEDISDFTAIDNTLAGLFNPFSYTGRQAAEISADLFDGQTDITAVIPRPARQMAFIDFRNAEKLAISIPFAALEAVDMVVR
ncbi:ABC transporter substrate-binding protein [Desulfurivibrio alkaliphilus]|uniref:ABC transporter substrate-binding protein n=1 Tax=Desulfurivibrio alkaliphilus (strain DSM 19089 / UNIQEM U267 / AHT2) TaxID=589865 RepID=D6YZW4_DESAT|nr:hypothetical protein [Desulfurivibrio alkaliphilus]ADH85121.1 hypothetical protein DaAHT2_0415 [Desulfurivibrio alkaliphilus AHT 2]